jgi:ferric-dicitrate binding protein FerR (iron transport regulator)
MMDADDPIVALLRWAGPRPRVDGEIQARVRRVFDDEFARMAARRKRVRRFAGFGLAAAALVAGIVFLWPRPAATIIETLPGDTRSLEWNGATLRLDEGTRVTLLSNNVAVLDQGTIFYSSDRSASGATIRTRFGEIRDRGTQFEVRLGDDFLRVRVQEGRVELRRGADVFPVPAGTELTVTAKTAAAPPFVLEGMTLGQVVERVAREKGLRVEWKTRASRTRVLHGTIPLTLDEALDAAAAASGVTYRIERGTLVLR